MKNREQMQIILAHEAGRPIRRRKKDSDDLWQVIEGCSHMFNFEAYEYRIETIKEDKHIEIMNEFYIWYYSYRDSLETPLAKEHFENAMLFLKEAYITGNSRGKIKG